MTRAPGPARRPLRPAGLRSEDRGVSDIVGSILLVGITVIAAVGFGLLILSFDGPADTQHSRLVVSMAPGAGGWNTGDEEIRLAHLGGEPLDADAVRILYTPPSGSAVTVSGGALGSAFADGELTTGETWTRTLTAALNDLYSIRVVVDGGARSQLVADSTVVAGSTGGGVLCLGDTQAPTAAFAATNVNSLSSGPVTITVTLSDNCSGVDESVVPHLLWCVAVTCTVPTSYTDAGTMTDIGLRMWSANVPSHVWLTQALAGASLRYYVTSMTDNNANVAQSSVLVDLVDLVLTYSYVEGANAVTGSVGSLANAQTAADGVEADVAEGAVAGVPGTGGPTKFSGASVTNSGALNPNNALASDDSRTEFDTTGDFIEVTGFDLPANAASVTAISIGYEGRKASSGGTSPTTRLDYKVGAGSYSTGTSITESATSDTDRTRSLSGTFSVADVESMTVRVFYVTDTTRNAQVDHVFVTVTYTTTPATNYATNVELEWTTVPAGTTQLIELRYRVTGDTFNVQVWNYLTSTWRTCTGTLTAASLTSYSCALVLPAEYSAGEVLVRFTDATPAGTTQGHLFLDYVRVGTA